MTDVCRPVTLASVPHGRAAPGGGHSPSFHRIGGGLMGSVNVGRENSAPIDIYYEDQGSGPAVVLSSGWPFDSRSWEPQVHPLLAAGYRVITYDRRGFGRSSRPSAGYDFDTLAADLGTLLRELDLGDVTVVGFSLGTGEVASYIGRNGNDRLRRV